MFSIHWWLLPTSVTKLWLQIWLPIAFISSPLAFSLFLFCLDMFLWQSSYAAQTVFELASYCLRLPGLAGLCTTTADLLELKFLKSPILCLSELRILSYSMNNNNAPAYTHENPPLTSVSSEERPACFLEPLLCFELSWPQTPVHSWNYFSIEEQLLLVTTGI